MEDHASVKNFIYSKISMEFVRKRVISEEIAKRWNTFQRPERGIARRIHNSFKAYDSAPIIIFGIPLTFLFTSGAIFYRMNSISAIANLAISAALFIGLMDAAKVYYAFSYYGKEIELIQEKYDVKVRIPYSN
ncbi:unnamed protein product [Blepharisma stoltei]|uniref:Uncharacterized protein n=1 Tax=Blepharisma stoltei TaxID=1481888 RepID=A0AAU9JRP5_9CILI|nr:unnamed protein product [Blepharisma stoltei]